MTGAQRQEEQGRWEGQPEGLGEAQGGTRQPQWAEI